MGGEEGSRAQGFPSSRFDAVVDSIPRVVAIERESGAGELSEQRVQRGTPVSFSLSLSLCFPLSVFLFTPSTATSKIPSVVHYVSLREKLAFRTRDWLSDKISFNKNTHTHTCTLWEEGDNALANSRESTK